jgi:hypothetical protein
MEYTQKYPTPKVDGYDLVFLIHSSVGGRSNCDLYWAVNRSDGKTGQWRVFAAEPGCDFLVPPEEINLYVGDDDFLREVRARGLGWPTISEGRPTMQLRWFMATAAEEEQEPVATPLRGWSGPQGYVLQQQWTDGVWRKVEVAWE